MENGKFFSGKLPTKGKSSSDRQKSKWQWASRLQESARLPKFLNLNKYFIVFSLF
jgi:hypothetical protein